jgi:hypothetical protein
MLMSATDLTPVERGALFVLMAEGRPLKESSELKEVHGLALKASHRSKLQRLGLIHTTKDPFFTHSLSEKGWQWLKKETSAPKPKGTMGMGALYAVLHGLRRHTERNGFRLEDVFGKTAPTGSEGATEPIGDSAIVKENENASAREGLSRQHMHEAAWSEADEALGQALQDIPVFTKAIEALQQASPADLDRLVKRTSAAGKLVMQSVRHAGRKRELELVIEPGIETAFDPALHRSEDAPHPGDRVRIRKPPVMQGPANARIVIIPGEVDPI